MCSAYLPPTSWFVRLRLGEPCVVGDDEYYQKQTIRNRCTIDSPGGPLRLTVPIDKANFRADGKCLMKDVRISYRQDWRHQHWHALQSSYYNSPFFEYLQDDFRPVYEKQWAFLVDLNETLIHTCCELIGFQPDIRPTTDFKKEGGCPITIEPPPYYQVFAPRHGFLPDLSVIDLIFNLGPESLLYLNSLQA